MTSRENFLKFKMGLRNPKLLLREINSISHRLYPGWNYRQRGEDFLQQDWDNLLILDACRYDMFKAENSIPGELTCRYSKASSTVGFLRTNVEGTDLTDTIYVTANGQIHHYKDELDTNFYDMIPLYADAWDDELGTVPPAAVTESAIEAAQRHPNKRLLVHYVQPHFPFIGSETTEDKHRIGDSSVNRSFWRRVFDGDVTMTRDEIWTAYTNTLRLVLRHVEPVIKELPGKTVVTSDHGNMVGERGHPLPIREWGHPDELYYQELVEVPWLECPFSERKKVVADTPVDRDLATDPAVVEKRLKDLGYY